ncbi:MAG: hypothetical protein ACXACG_04165 [Candidatus Thorarchaeota archaeon]|jgi:hypothetical protein
MSEAPDCPYCGAKVHTERVMDYDSKIKLRCNNCGGFFEFLPGFGAFTLPEQERRRSVRRDGSVSWPHYDVYEAEAPWGTERPPAQRGSCGTCIVILCCLCFILPTIVLIMSIVLGFGFFWFW